MKTTEPLTFLTGIYEHLPEELATLRGRRRRDLARQAVQMAFEAYRRRDMSRARSAVWQAVAYRPTLLFDRGFLSMLLRTSILPFHNRLREPETLTSGEGQSFTQDGDSAQERTVLRQAF